MKSGMMIIGSNVLTIGLIAGLIVLLFLTGGGWEWLTCERGEIIGEFVNGETEGFGDFCGQYPFTTLKLRNYTVDGEISAWSDRFHFGNQINFLDELIPGVCYVFYYHETSRPADTSPGEMINYYVLDGYKEV
jgi:hypothetical protein